MPQITLRAARVNAGFKQTEVANILKVAVTTIRNWEKGVTQPRQPAIEKLCELYGVPYDNIKFSV